MRLCTAFTLIAALVFAPSPADAGKSAAKLRNPNALPADGAWAKGKIRAVTLKVRSAMAVPGVDGAVGPAITQTMRVAKGRGVMEMSSAGYLPKAIHLRYNAATRRYLVVDRAQKRFWVMTGSQVSNLMQRGPRVEHSNYKVTISKAQKGTKVLGFATKKSTARISFDATYQMKSGSKTTKVQLLLTFWHTADKRFDRAWGRTLVALTAFPFQDKANNKVIDTLEAQISFPLKWEMVFAQSGGRGQSQSFPTLTTTVTKTTIGEMRRARFQWPPARCKPATKPFHRRKRGARK